MMVARLEPEIVASRCVWLNGRELDATQLRQALAAKDAALGSLHAIVRTLLTQARQQGRPLVVIVREADAAQASQLEWLRLALECTPDALDLVRFVLLGTPTLLATLRRPEARALATRVTSRIASDGESARVPMTPPRSPRARRVVAAGMLGAAVSIGVVALVSAPSWLLPPSPAEDSAPTMPSHVATQSAEVTAPPPVEALPPPPAIVHPPTLQPRSTPRHGTGHEQRLQVGAFRNLPNATALRDELGKRFALVTVTETTPGGVTFYRVRIEGLVGDAAVHAALETLRGAGHQAIRVRD
jgi:hypothetical protein